MRICVNFPLLWVLKSYRYGFVWGLYAFLPSSPTGPTWFFSESLVLFYMVNLFKTENTVFIKLFRRPTLRYGGGLLIVFENKSIADKTEREFGAGYIAY